VLSSNKLQSEVQDCIWEMQLKTALVATAGKTLIRPIKTRRLLHSLPGRAGPEIMRFRGNQKTSATVTRGMEASFHLKYLKLGMGRFNQNTI